MMGLTRDYDFIKYLEAKRTVDDRALNKDVWTVLKRELDSLRRNVPMPRVLEIGAGIGTMFERCMEWGLFESCEYTALDSMGENIEEAAQRLVKWAPPMGCSLKNPSDTHFLLERDGHRTSVRFVAADFFDFLEQVDVSEKWDLLMANAFLDLLDVGASLKKLFSVLKPGNLFYFSVNFDGGTFLEPEIDSGLDCLIENLYHQTMDSRITRGRPSGDSRTGRHLFGHLRDVGAHLLAAGSSDWVVYADGGGYQGKEAYFLHFIIDTMGKALAGHPDLNPRMFEEWLRVRHEQIDNAVLVYIAHQLDFVGRSPENA
jgi:SAM-dependent methyltransferase